MKVEKLPSGSYRIQKYLNGKRHSITFDKKPTNKEIEEALYKLRLEQDEAAKADSINGNLTFEEATLKIIENKRNVLSPSSIRTYKSKMYKLSSKFLSMKVDDITNNDVQAEVNRLALDREPKTVKDYYSIITTTLTTLRPDLRLVVKLPLRTNKEEPYIPTSEDIKRILAYEDNQYSVAFMLGCFGMRVEEVCALTMDDINFDDGSIRIDKALVLDDNLKWVVSKTKTSASTRTIVVPANVLEAIKRNGLCTCYPHSITRHLGIVEDKLGIEHFSFHKLRHYFASQSHAQGMSDADIMAFGGWETDNIMKSVYRHATSSASAISSAISSTIF